MSTSSVRSSVVVDGVTLTRAQVEEALAELNKPAEPTAEEHIAALQPGDHITFTRQYPPYGYNTYIVTSAPRLYVNIANGKQWGADDAVVAFHLRNGRLTIQKRMGRS